MSSNSIVCTVNWVVKSIFILLYSFVDGEEYNHMTESQALSILRTYTYNENEFDELWQRMRSEVVITS